MKVNKIGETKEYGVVFDVELPVRFYFLTESKLQLKEHQNVTLNSSKNLW